MKESNSIDSQIKRGTIEMLLLRLIAEDPSYGYELVQRLDRRSSGLIEIREGTLYPVLYRMEDAGLIAAEWETPERGTPRKYYSITVSGRERLDELTTSWRRWIDAVSGIME